MTQLPATSPIYPASTAQEPSPLLDFLTFLGKKLLNILITLFIIIFIAYVGLGMVQGLSVVESTQEALPKTFTYIGRLLQGDLGTSQRGRDLAMAVTRR